MCATHGVDNFVIIPRFRSSDTTKFMSISEPDFRFKQFAIWHDQCAMKVNTDGILLGAWAALNNKSQNKKIRLLDIGTGTGLIALMLAQRCQQNQMSVTIDAVEIDSAAAKQAEFNVRQSPWADSINIHQQDITEFAQQTNNRAKFDVIVSNPPYFSDSLLGDDKQRNQARHNHGLSFEQLLASASELASENAKLQLILPCDEAVRLLNNSEKNGWYLTSKIEVTTLSGKVPFRSLLCLSRNKLENVTTDSITIRQNKQEYHPEFKTLCKDFYLKF